MISIHYPFKNTMKESKHSRRLNSSLAFMHIELLLFAEVQALGELDIELTKEFSKTKIDMTSSAP